MLSLFMEIIEYFYNLFPFFLSSYFLSFAFSYGVWFCVIISLFFSSFSNFLSSNVAVVTVKITYADI